MVGYIVSRAARGKTVKFLDLLRISPIRTGKNAHSNIFFINAWFLRNKALHYTEHKRFCYAKVYLDILTNGKSYKVQTGEKRQG